MGVPRVEEQIHAGQLAEEDRRCEELKRAGQRVTRREILPWKRIGPQAICKDPDLLRHVNEFDYDLADEGFQGYCHQRGVLHVAGEPGSSYWGFCVDVRKAREQYLADPHFRCSMGGQYQFTDEESLVRWRLACLARAALQDCWELYLTHTGTAQTRRGGS